MNELCMLMIPLFGEAMGMTYLCYRVMSLAVRDLIIDRIS